MRTSNWTPSIVPNEDDQTVYLAVDDLAHEAGLGRLTLKRPTWRRSYQIYFPANTMIPSASSDLTPRKNVRRMSADVAHQLQRRCNEQMREVPFFLQDFVDRHKDGYCDIQLPLLMRLV